MATTAELSENSHQGFEGLKAALCLASMEAKSNNASGMVACLRREGIGSRCSGKERDETGLDYFGARYFSGALGRFTSTDPVVMTVQRLADPQRINLYAYARNNPLAFIDPYGEYIKFASDEDERIYNEYLAYLNSDPEKYKNELATIEQLTGSEVEYNVGTSIKEGTREGGVETDGTTLFVTVSNTGGPAGEDFSLNARMGQEFEHARQFDSGEFGFLKGKDGKWRANPSNFTIGDEVNGWNVSLNLAINSDFWTNAGNPSTLSKYRDAKSDDERAGVLIRSSRNYSRLGRAMNRNVTVRSDSGYKPGQLVKTENGFFRVPGK